MNSTALEVTGTVDREEDRQNEIHARGRKAAARFLERRGYEVLDRDWKCRAGIIDLVCMDGETLVFIQVKVRADATKGFPSDDMILRKHDRFERIATSYLQAFHLSDMAVRFDVISLLILGPERAFLRHHINALGCM